MKKIYTKGNYLYIILPSGNEIINPQKNITFTRVDNTNKFYYQTPDKSNNGTHIWSDFVKEDDSPFSSIDEFETYVATNTGNFNSGSASNFDPQDYDLDEFQNQGSDPFVRESDLTTKADLVGGIVPASQLPSYVDDVIEFDTLTDFPAIGEEGKIYVTKDTNRIYRWSGSIYVDITQENDTLASVTARGNETIYSMKSFADIEGATLSVTSQIDDTQKVSFKGDNVFGSYDIQVPDWSGSATMMIEENMSLYVQGEGGQVGVFVGDKNVRGFSGLLYDYTNNRLAVGVTIPTTTIDTSTLRVRNLPTGDTTYTKTVVSKTDGTLGVVDLDTLQTVIDRDNRTTKAIRTLDDTPLGAAFYVDIQSKKVTYSSWVGNMNPNHTGSLNMAFGYGALQNITTGGYNVAYGSYAGNVLTTGSWNTFLGSSTGLKSTTGNSNVFVGDDAGFENITGFKSVLIGVGAGYSTTDGKLNTIIGYKSAIGSNIGDRNTYLGAFSGEGATGSNNILIGIGAGRADGAISNKLIIHSNSTLAGYTNTAEGNYGNAQHGQLARGLITGDFVDRWVRINGYITVGSPGVSTSDISIIPGQGIKSTVYYTPTLDTDYVQKQYVDTKSIPLINTATVYTTSAELNTAYPNALLGQEVYTTGETTFFKKVTPTTWARLGLALI